MASVIQDSHPFYPLEANIVGYLANELSVPALLASFALGCALILGGTLAILRLNKPLLPATEKATVLWFILSKYMRPHPKLVDQLISFCFQVGQYISSLKVTVP